MRPGRPPKGPSFSWERLLQPAGTALLAGTLLLRVLRTLENLESVRRFYSGAGGPVWTPLFLALFLGPYLTAVSAAAALWLSGNRAEWLGAVSAGAAAFFVLEEGLTVFARSMNSHSGYVGAEPLFSLLACAVSAAAVLRARRRERRTHL